MAETVSCPQCAGRGRTLGIFLKKPWMVFKFGKWIAVMIATEVWRGITTHRCDACDATGSVPKEWVEE